MQENLLLIKLLQIIIIENDNNNSYNNSIIALENMNEWMNKYKKLRLYKRTPTFT